MSALAAEIPALGVGRLALLGTGTVGSAFVQRYQALRARGLELPSVQWLANSRTALEIDRDLALPLELARRAPRDGQSSPPWASAEGLERGDVVVDATASEDVAARHVQWLARGVHVVTANKLGRGAQLARAHRRAVAIACATVGTAFRNGLRAGLPLLSSLRALVAGGDHIHAIEGVLSGSLAWLFHRYDGQSPFSAAVREALAAGYTEPDPRLDLSGEDVRRKLLILARSSGLALDASQVQVDSLVPEALAALPLEDAVAALEQLDAPLRARWQQAHDNGRVLRFVGRVDGEGAQVGLRELPADHPLAQGAGTDNRVAIHSDRYHRQPLLIQGPGAGAEVTAAALLDDVLRIVG